MNRGITDRVRLVVRLWKFAGYSKMPETLAALREFAKRQSRTKAEKIIRLFLQEKNKYGEAK